MLLYFTQVTRKPMIANMFKYSRMQFVTTSCLTNRQHDATRVEKMLCATYNGVYLKFNLNDRTMDWMLRNSKAKISSARSSGTKLMAQRSCLPVSAEATPGSAVASISTVTAPSPVAAPASVSTPAATTTPPSIHTLVDREHRQQHQQQSKLWKFKNKS